MKFYRARETDGSASQTFDSGSQGQIQGKITGKDHRCAVGTKMQNGTFCMYAVVKSHGSERRGNDQTRSDPM